MGRKRWFIPAGAIGAALLIAAMAAIIGGMMMALREGSNNNAKATTVVVKVFIRDSVTPEQMKALDAKIKSLPGVASYEYVSKEEALRRFGHGVSQRLLTNPPANTMAASYAIHVEGAARAYAVAQQFFYDPTVNSDPGTHNGVWVSSRAGVPPARTGIVGRILVSGGPAPGAAQPYPASEVKVIDSSGQVVAVVPPQPNAKFRVDLFPGVYTVEARPTAGNPRFQPRKVTVHAGRYSRVDIYAQIP